MKQVTVYTSSTCPHCHTAKAYLQSEHIPFIERNTSVDPAASQELQKLGARGVPTFVIGEEVIVGFNRDAVENAIDFKVQACPKCGTYLRVPKGKGRLRVTCKSCGEKFEMNT